MESPKASHSPQIACLYSLVGKSWQEMRNMKASLTSAPFQHSDFFVCLFVSYDKVEKAHWTGINCLSSSKNSKIRVYKHIWHVFSCKPLGKMQETVSKIKAQPLSSFLYYHNSNKWIFRLCWERKADQPQVPRPTWPQSKTAQSSTQPNPRVKRLNKALMSQLLYLQERTTWTPLGGISLSPN